MNTTDLYDRFRSDVYDTQEPYLWSDVEVFQYMDAAQKQFCRLAGGIADSTSPLTQVSVSTGEPWAAIDSRILKIRRVQRQSDSKKVEVINHEDLDRLLDGDDYGTRRQFKLDNMPGEVRFIITNMEQDKIRLIRVPAVDDTLEMSVYRMPLKSVTGKDQKFEIHEQHHEYLLHWMKKLAYSKQDAETRNDKVAETNETKFRQYCDQARLEREAREHKARVISYGGI